MSPRTLMFPVLGLALACECTGVGAGEAQYPCASTAECSDGWLCLHGYCTDVVIGSPPAIVVAGGGSEGGGAAGGEAGGEGGGAVGSGGGAAVGGGGGGAGSGAGGGAGAGGGGGGAADAGLTCTPAAESCADGIDNDCDQLVDCADPDCEFKRCSAGAASACCGTTCVDLGADRTNCGGCGVACKPGTTCERVGVGAIQSGVCTCNPNHGDDDCPLIYGDKDQDCEDIGGGFYACTCNTDNRDRECPFPASACTESRGLSFPGMCFYP